MWNSWTDIARARASRFLKRCGVALSLCLLAGCSCAPSLVQENQRLKQEVQALQIENQGLRKAVLRERREELRQQLDKSRAPP